jgi:tetratricopeptide (TPR) repeat protein
LRDASCSQGTSYRLQHLKAQGLNALGQPLRAAAFARQLLGRRSQWVHPSDELAASRYESVLGESLTLLKNYAEAETHLQKAFHAQQQRVLPQQFDFVETRQRLARLYRAWGKPDEARQYESDNVRQVSNLPHTLGSP